MDSALIMAEWYLKINWSIIPIVPKTKIPPINWSKFQERRADIEEVKIWLKKGWYLALVTGDISNVLIVDDDRVKHGLEEWGFDSSIISKTQNNGKHFYFLYDRELHSHSNAELRIDLKAWHSYCLLPPFNGREWIKKPSHKNIKKLKPLNDETVRLINSDAKTKNGERKPIVLSDFLSITEGGRTDSLYKIACSLFAKHKKDEALQILLGVNQTYLPPLNEKEFKYQVERAKQFVNENYTFNYVKRNVSKPMSLADIGRRRIEDRNLEKSSPLTGYPELDKLVKGFLPKHFWTFTGETNAGKTTFACNLAENIRKQGRKLCYVALEPENKVVDYLATARLDKTFEDLTDEDLLFNDDLIDVLTLEQVPTYKDLINTLRASARYDVIFIDHIGYFCRSSDSNFITEQAKTIRDLVAITKEMEFCLVAIAHPRKPSPNQKERVLNVHDIGGTSAFAQDSTEVLSLHRTTINTENPLIIKMSDAGTLFVLKTKAGVNGSFSLNFKQNSGKVTSPESSLPPPTNVEHGFTKQEYQEGEILEEVIS